MVLILLNSLFILTAFSASLTFSGETNLLEQPWMKTIAERHKKTPAQVLLRYLIQRHIVVQPKSSMPSRIKENAQVR